MNELTAIDILIDPDDSMRERAKSFNQRMLQSVPAPTGFSLDEHHQPHMTTLQRYVRTAALPQVFAAVKGVLASVDLSKLTLTAAEIKHLASSELEGIGIAFIQMQTEPEVLEFQARLIDAAAPFTESGGTADAYVRTEAEPDISAETIAFIEHYVPAASGDNYFMHVTVGLAKLDDLRAIEAEPFESFTFSPAGLSIYQLGNEGTAAKHLKSFTL
jgi:hypothetical protein